jgi:threonine/homoserine/homoserine lactone efflux protein
MGDAIGQVLALGLAVGLSPVPVIAVLLLLGTPRAAANAVAFAGGWVAGLAAVSTLVLLVSRGADAATDSGPATWVAILQLALGAGLIGLGVKQWRDRPRPEAPPELPGWMQAIDQFRPRRALGFGVLLAAANPKHLVFAVAAAAAVAETGTSGVDEAVGVAVFVAIGSLGVGVPVGAHLGLGERASRPLQELRAWLVAHNAAIMAVLLLLMGAKLAGDGLAAL